MNAITPIVPDEDACWRAVLERDAGLDGAFVYAVRSTGIFCRPSCPSRRPGRAQAHFFAVPEAAEQAGYRSCKRCRPKDAAAADPRLETVRRVCRAVEDSTESVPTLAALGAAL
ncbi:MAG: Ada metal-binding domain-containing protein, partial [Rhodospirillales bacterium]|nr:Ada metal-binding domain-containing protein [Rhodospirillales bacterium]